jgi:hypothetical protein
VPSLKKTNRADGRRLSIIYETHSLSTDNDLGIATGWKDGQLSEQGRADAKELGEKQVHDGIDAVFASDLGRAVEIVKIAFVDSRIPIYLDSRLRECNYGDWNGAPVTRIHSSRSEYIVQPYPNGHRRGSWYGRIFERSSRELEWPSCVDCWPRGHAVGVGSPGMRLYPAKSNNMSTRAAQRPWHSAEEGLHQGSRGHLTKRNDQVC